MFFWRRKAEGFESVNLRLGDAAHPGCDTVNSGRKSRPRMIHAPPAARTASHE